MKLGVIGGGVVGQATARTYLEHVEEVQVYDVVKERSTVGDNLARVMELSDIIFLCLPEAAINPFFQSLPPGAMEDVRGKNLVLKSTVPIGTTRRLHREYGLDNLVHSPEFLTTRCAFTDAQVPSRNIIGYPGWNFKGGCEPKDYLEEFKQPYEQGLVSLTTLYMQRWPHVPIHFLKSDESEAAKLILNGYFAVKVSYFNEVNLMCRKMDLDWNRVLQGVITDGRVGGSHTKVPGPDGNYGFGGTCLPKDLLQLIHNIEESGAAAPVCRAVHERNKLDRGRN